MSDNYGNYDIGEITLITQCIKIIKTSQKIDDKENNPLSDRTIEASKSLFETAVNENSFMLFFHKLFKDVNQETNLNPSFSDINLSLDKYTEKYKEYLEFYKFLVNIFDFDFKNYSKNETSTSLMTFFIRYMLLKGELEFLLTLECYLVYNTEKDLIEKYTALKEFQNFILPKLSKKETLIYLHYEKIKNSDYDLTHLTHYIENMREKLQEKDCENYSEPEIPVTNSIETQIEETPVEENSDRQNSEEQKPKDKQADKKSIIEHIKKMQADGITLDDEIKQELLQAIYNDKIPFYVYLSVSSCYYQKNSEYLTTIESSLNEAANSDSELKVRLKNIIPEYNRIYDDVNEYIFTLSYTEPETDLEFKVTIPDYEVEHKKREIETVVHTRTSPVNTYTSAEPSSSFNSYCYNNFNLIDCLNIDPSEFKYDDTDYSNDNNNYGGNSYDDDLDDEFPF